MIADGLLTASVLVLIFALADVFLSENQKERIEIALTQLWSKLDDYKAQSLFPMFRSFHFKVVAFFVGTLTPAALAAILPPGPGVAILPLTLKDVFTRLVIGFVPSLASIIALTWITSASGRMIAVRAVFAVVILIFVFWYGMPLVIEPLLVMIAVPPPPGGYTTDYGMTGFATFTLMFLSFCSIVIIMAFPLVLIQFLRASIVVVEFMVRRIAEYPKGSILAASALATAALSVFKALS